MHEMLTILTDFRDVCLSVCLSRGLNRWQRVKRTPRGMCAGVIWCSRCQMPLSSCYVFFSLGHFWTQNVHNEYPYHVDTLLQLGEILKMGDDRQAAAEMTGMLK